MFAKPCIAFFLLVAVLSMASRSSAETLSWDPNPNQETEIVGYVVHLREAGAEEVIDYDVGNTTSFPIPIVLPGMTIELAVSAYDEYGVEGPWSEPVTYTFPLSTEGLQIIWSPSPKAGVTDYRLYFGPLNQAAVSVSLGTSTSWVFPTALRGTTYFFYVEARNASGDVLDLYETLTYGVPLIGPFEDLQLTRANASPEVILTAPSTGSTLTEGVSVTLRASASDSDGAITRVDFYAGSTKVGTATGPFSISWSPTSTGAFQLTAKAFDNDGGRTTSDPRDVTVIAGVPLPAKPSDFIPIAKSATVVNLSWTDRAVNESGFYLYRLSETEPLTLIATLPANSSSFTNKGLLAGAEYEYRIAAFNSAGKSAATVGTVSTPQARPSAPTSLVAVSQSSSSISLTWTDTSANESGFYVDRALAGGTYTRIATVVSNATGFTDTGLTGATAYSYRVRAFNSAGISAAATATATTSPVAPTAFTAVPLSSTRIKLTWSDNSSNELGFNIYRSVNGGPFSLLTTLPPDTVSYINGSLTPGTMHLYGITSFNAEGQSSAAITTAATPP
jgi:hypothetical protein